MFGIEAIEYWHWWILAFVLLMAEMFSPAAFFIWIGSAAGIVGFLMMGIDMGWKAQFLAFAVLSIACVVAGRMWFKRSTVSSDKPNLNRRGQELVGRTFSVEQAIINGAGRLRVGETTWKAAGPDAQIGVTVKVVGIESAVLQVELVD